MIVVISDPSEVQNEAKIINELFNSGMEVFHLRKPYYKCRQTKELLKQINSEHYSKIALHQCHEIAEEFGIKRLHYPESHCKEANVNKKISSLILSTSIHSVDRLEQWMNVFNYCFYGPVFDSISKVGYKKMRSIQLNLLRKTYLRKIIGVGGINYKNLNIIHKTGFDGCGLLGYIWKEPKMAIINFNKIKAKWAKRGQ